MEKFYSTVGITDPNMGFVVLFLIDAFSEVIQLVDMEAIKIKLLENLPKMR